MFVDLRYRLHYLQARNYSVLFNWDLSGVYANTDWLCKETLADCTILFVFAGRKDRMSASMVYLNQLLKQKSVDYIHIWNFSRNISDFNWVKSLNDPEKKIYVFSPVNFGKYTHYAYRLYKTAYSFYTKDCYRKINFIKSDDDMVFIETDKELFKQFVHQIKLINEPQSSHFLVSSNVVNNGVCAYYQQKEFKLIPHDIGDCYFPCDNDIPGFAMEAYWDGGEKSEKLHHYFLAKSKNFINMARVIDPVNIKIGTRVSINFIGFKQDSIKKFLKSRCQDDEKFLTAELSNQLNKHVQIFMPLVSSHLSYFTQSLQNDDDLIVKYFKWIDSWEMI